MHYSTGRDYVFPLVDAAYRTLVIFVYIVITNTKCLSISSKKAAGVYTILSFKS